MTPNHLANYRETTLRYTSSPIGRYMSNKRRCCSCQELKTTGGGSIRHRRFYCKECYEANSKDKPGVSCNSPSEKRHDTEPRQSQREIPTLSPRDDSADKATPSGVSLLRSGSRTVLYFGKGRKYHRVIAMRSRKLMLENLTDQQFSSRMYEPMTGSVQHAMEIFQKHAMSDKAAEFIDRELLKVKK